MKVSHTYHSALSACIALPAVHLYAGRDYNFEVSTCICLILSTHCIMLCTYMPADCNFEVSIICFDTEGFTCAYHSHALAACCIMIKLLTQFKLSQTVISHHLPYTNSLTEKNDRFTAFKALYFLDNYQSTDSLTDLLTSNTVQHFFESSQSPSHTYRKV